LDEAVVEVAAEAVAFLEGGAELAFAGAEGFLGLLAVGDIAGDALDGGGGAIAEEEAAIDFEDEGLAGGGAEAEFVGGAGCGAGGFGGDLLVDEGEVGGVDPILDAGADDLVGWDAEQFLAGVVDRGDDALEVVGVDDVVGVFEEVEPALLEGGFALADGFGLGADALAEGEGVGGGEEDGGEEGAEGPEGLALAALG